MKPVRLSPRAESDLEGIADWIAKDSPGRAETFVDEIVSKCLSLSAMPEAHPVRAEYGKTVRVLVHWPYLIFYRVLKAEIRIDRIVHGARKLKRRR